MATIKDILINSSLTRLETEMLLGFVLNKSREELLTYPEFTINPQTLVKFKRLEEKRHNNWPLAYLIKSQEFYGLSLNVSPAVLIPRPETEIIVDILKDALKKLPNKTNSLLIDVGTGSGAIIISVAKEIKLLPKLFSKITFLGIDISESALQVAKLNADKQKLGQKIKFLKSNLLGKIESNKYKGRDLLVAANLPYLTPKQIDSEQSIKREPKLALNGGQDGLDCYRKLFKQLNDLSARSLFLVCEIDPSQTIKITKLAKNIIKNTTSEIKKDLRGKNRFIIIKKTAY